ncbi:MAG: ribonuclease Z [Bacteroidia bacterium]|nr:MAG: ribonuclease Z [Bacteroidia bacterium]
MFKLCVLGSSAAIPMFNRGLSGQVIIHDSGTYLIDCGEGTQFQIQKYKIKLKNLKAIFISHNHGDHILGLPGLLSTLSMLERTEPLLIYAPEGLKNWVLQFFHLSVSVLKYEVHWTELPQLQEKQLIYEADKLSIYAFPLVHRIACNGFSFEEKNKSLRLNIQKLKEKNLPKEYYPILKMGQSVEFENEFYAYQDYTLPPNPPLSYTYASDTLYEENISKFFLNTHFLYHEATFLTNEIEKAQMTYHSTAKQAALQAMNAHAKFLMLGHFSARYFDLNELLIEAKQIFPKTLLALDGKIYDLNRLEENL